MKGITEFKIDKWVATHGAQAAPSLNLMSSYAAPLSLDDLKNLGADFAGHKKGPLDMNLSLAYAPKKGTQELRQHIAASQSRDGGASLTAENVVITPGSILANYLVLSTICGHGDHVICQYPTFGQLYTIPKYSGADVTLWEAREGQGWTLDIDELGKLVKPNTKAIIINNPCNPTGCVFSEGDLNRIIAIARQHRLIIVADEVFSPLFHQGPASPPLVSLGYDRTISTGSVSKAHGLPGIRIGWVITQDLEMMDKVLTARDYTTSSVSQLDDSVAAYALHPQLLPRLISRSLSIFKESISLVDSFVQKTDRCSWVKPVGGGVGFVKILNGEGKPVNDEDFCSRLQHETGISLIPGDVCFGETGGRDFQGYVRINLGNPALLRNSLDGLHNFIVRQ